ncbi:MAG: hypothetical protein JJU11_10475 [Candidatus Sumerlaeia bacterium]|nr:hypothetical protein [Candidatus Sumerlaeia bacterium]
MLRILQSAFIVCFFVAMMSLLVRDHIIPSLAKGDGIEVDYRILVDSWAGQDEWFEVRLGDMPLGAMRTVAERHEEADEYAILGHMELRTPFISGRLLTAASLNSRLEVQAARMVGAMGSPGGGMPNAQALADGELSDEAIEVLALIRNQNMNLRMKRGDSVQYLTQSMMRPVTMIDSVTPMLRGDMLSEGVVYSIDLYDPLMGGGSGRAEVEWVDSTTFVNDEGEDERMRNVEIRIGSLKTTVMVDDNGDVLRREIPIMGPTGSGVGSDSGPRIVMIRKDPWDLEKEYPDLNFVLKSPKISPTDVVGESTGEIFEGVNLMSMLGRGLRGRLPGGMGGGSTSE